MEVTGIPLGYAFGAGMVAAINLCGLAMLPAVVGYELGVWSVGSVRLARGVLFGLTATAGFLALFLAVGLVVVLGGRWLIGLVPWAALALGAGLALLGALTLFSRVELPAGGGLPGAFGVGVAYRVAFLSCALPIFLVVVAGALALGGLLEGLLVFLAYGLGMGLMLTAIAVLTAVFKDAVMGARRPAGRFLEPAGRLLLVGAGAYIVYCWGSSLFGWG